MLKERKLPEDLKKMNTQELDVVCREIRNELIDTVIENGGHLASNLGIVELTVALHTVFDSPRDKIVFDVGHQAYVHKLLTGRADRFSTLRTKDGISGFPSSVESEHDCFTAGHASTAISAALGMARARDLRGEDYHVIAVLGDGALTGGMCYEAMNDAGQSQTKLIIVLNDNEMSISQNVGAMSEHLSKLRQSASYTHAKSRIRRGLEKIPFIGKVTLHIVERIRDTLKTMLIGDHFFESLGFIYSGPINGHDTKKLIHAFSVAAEASRPVLIHVVTQKGRGYGPAEEHPDIYHGLSPKNQKPSEAVSAGKAAAQWLKEAAKEDDSICSVVAAMLSGTAMGSFKEEFPKRTFDVGIAEEHAVTMAAGMAFCGMRPYVAIYSTFLQRAIDQVQMDVCLPNLPVTFLIDRSGLVGEDGMTHQGVFDLTYLREMPGMTIAAPSNIADMKRMLFLSRESQGPVAIRYPKALPAGADEVETFAVGESKELVCGTDGAILAVGLMVYTALEVQSTLVHSGISLSVVDMRYVKPLDEKMLARFNGKKVFTIEENVLTGGFGAAVLEYNSKKGNSTEIYCFGVQDNFVAHGCIEEQRAMCGLTAGQVADKIKVYFEK